MTGPPGPAFAPPPLATASTPALRGEWRRLHPLSPIVRVGAMAVGVGVIIAPSLISSSPRRRSGSLTGVLVYAGVATLILVAGWARWAVTRWRVHGGHLQIETGLLRRDSIRIPLDRIQAVDVVAPLMARILGLAEVRVVSAGRGAERARLAYLSSTEAPGVRAALLALAHGLEAETPEPPAYHLARVENGQLIAALSMRAEVAVPIVVLVAVVAVAISQPRLVAIAPAALVAAISSGLNALRVFNDDFNFVLSEAGDGYRLDRGLLQTRHETIPFGRVQAVRLVQPLLWRPLGWCRLEIDVARQHVRSQQDRDANLVAHILLPVARLDQAAWLLSRVMPGAQMLPPPGSQPPRRAMLRAPLSYHFLAAWIGDTHVCARTGRITAHTVVIPLSKVQSVRLRQGPVQRALRLASVHVDTAGHRWQAAAHCRDAAEAEAMLERVAVSARQARRVRAPGVT